MQCSFGMVGVFGIVLKSGANPILPTLPYIIPIIPVCSSMFFSISGNPALNP